MRICTIFQKSFSVVSFSPIDGVLGILRFRNQRGSMSIIGREIVSTILAVLEVQTRNEQRQLVSRMATEAEEILRGTGAESHAGEVFDLFRAMDKEHGTSPRVKELRDGIVVNRLHNWGIATFEQAEILRARLEEKYSPLRRELFGSRSRSAHVGAVLRPFRRKYLDIWADTFGSDFNMASVESAVEDLNNARIENEVELHLWSEEVYELFRKIAVLPKTERDSLVEENKKPLGMIGEGSERTYRQQWQFWMRKHASSILTGQFEVRPLTQEPSYLGFSQGPPSSIYRSDYEERPLVFQAPPEQVNPGMGSFISPGDENSEKVTILLKSVADSNLSAERTWLSRRAAVNELPGWISTLSAFWGEAALSISVELSIATFSGESKFNLPALKLAEASETLARALTTYQ